MAATSGSHRTFFKLTKAWQLSGCDITLSILISLKRPVHLLNIWQTCQILKSIESLTVSHLILALQPGLFVFKFVDQSARPCVPLKAIMHWSPRAKSATTLTVMRLPLLEMAEFSRKHVRMVTGRDCGRSTGAPMFVPASRLCSKHKNGSGAGTFNLHVSRFFM